MMVAAKPIPPLSPDDIERFWARVDKTPGQGPNGECHIWTGDLDKNSYGRFYLDGRKTFAHRVVYVITHGEIPEDKPCVLHSCDWPPCVNEDHLFAGTDADNVADMISKGRDRKVRGEASGKAKLTTADVQRILTMPGTLVEIAKEMGIHLSCASSIKRRRTWKHVPFPIEGSSDDRLRR